MRLARNVFAFMVLATLFFSCTKQDLNDDEILIEPQEIFATGDDTVTPPDKDKGNG